MRRLKISVTSNCSFINLVFASIRDIFTEMLHSIVTLLVCLALVSTVFSENLNGIFNIESCQCSSPTETCEPNGPFIFNHEKSTIAVKFGSIQVGVGTIGNNRLDLYLNQNRCKGLWNTKSHVAELKCQHQAGIICTTHIRCISGPCLNDTSISIVSAATTTTTATSCFLFSMSTLLTLVYFY